DRTKRRRNRSRKSDLIVLGSVKCLGKDSIIIKSSEKLCTGNHLIQYKPERIDVSTTSDGFSQELFGGTVLRSSRHSKLTSSFELFRDSKVQDYYTSPRLLDHNILRLDITMNYRRSLSMGIHERAGNLAANIEHFRQWQRSALFNVLLECSSLNVL